jgi:DNA modification methylase
MNILLKLIAPNIELWGLHRKLDLPFIKLPVNSQANLPSLGEQKLALHSARTTAVNPNFHRAHLSSKEGVNHALSHKFLRELVQQIKANNDFKNDDTAIIPFGGPGSMAVYLSNEGIRTLSGDINYKAGTPYGTAEERLGKSATNPKAKVELMKFQEWDATQLPLASDSQSLMIINPPYGIKCNLFSNPAHQESPERLLLDSLEEAHRVLKAKGVVYLFWPSEKINNIKKIIEPNFNLSNETIISGNNLKLSLTRLEKK